MCVFIVAESLAATEWQVLKGKHFLVYHANNKELAETVLRGAEENYERIMNDLGFAKRDDFWLWDDRVSIYIHATRDDFLRATGSPQWASGKSEFKRKEIVTFAGKPDFINSVLPHELAHLILRDFVGFKGEIPLWLNEGVAQWEESRKRPQSVEFVRQLNAAGKLISLADLAKLDIRKVNDFGKAAEFYAESASVVGYLIQQHGAERFRKFCGQIRDGKDLDDALRFAYPDTIRNMAELESAWKRYISQI